MLIRDCDDDYLPKRHRTHVLSKILQESQNFTNSKILRFLRDEKVKKAIDSHESKCYHIRIREFSETNLD